MRAIYTQAERERALALYREHGAAEAGRLSGVNPATIRTWARRAGETVSRGANARAHVEAARLSWAQRRSELTVRTGEIAAAILEQLASSRSAADARLLASTFATLVDKAQLLAGGAPARTETPNLTAMVDEAIDEILAQREHGDDST